MDKYLLLTPGYRRLLLTSLLLTLLLTLSTGFGQEPPPVTTESLPDLQQGKPGINTAIMEFEPALAIRASGCITCHAKIYSRYITDFGYGSPWFFGDPEGGNKVGPFNGHIYGDFIAEAGKTGLLTSEFNNEILVPKAEIDFNLRDAADTGLANQPSYQEALASDSLSKYIQALENQKSNPATVIEKNKVFIGAPDTATLEARFGITPGSGVNLKYIKSDSHASADFKGIELSANDGYYTNSSEIVCDGDLFVRGILFLNKTSLLTNTGCRIYAAGPVFLQNAVTFESSNAESDRANLQLVSSEAIFLGIGQKKCNKSATPDPLSARLLLTPALPSIFTRSKDRQSITPQTFMQNLYDKAASVPLEDSSCHDETLSLSGILLNAPIVHSRYSGKFRGLVIAEFALFFQGKSSYEFDPVFKKVPVLPRLKDSDFLVVE